MSVEANVRGFQLLGVAIFVRAFQDACSPPKRDGSERQAQREARLWLTKRSYLLDIYADIAGLNADQIVSGAKALEAAGWPRMKKKPTYVQRKKGNVLNDWKRA